MNKLDERMINLLEVYKFEDLLEMNDIELYEVLVWLYEEGHLDLPPEPC